MSQDKIAIVTVFFPIKSHRSIDFYLKYAEPFLSKCREHIILYTGSQYADIFRKIRGELPFTLVIDSVGEDNLPFDLPIRNILDKDTWANLALKIDDRHVEWLKKQNSSGNSVSLLQLWLSKAWFVSRTLEMEKFKDFQVFLWQDIGSCRNSIDQENLVRWPSLQKLKLRGYEDNRLVFYLRRKHSFDKDLRPDLDSDSAIAGASILGTRNAWIPVCEDIETMVKEVAEKYEDGIFDQTIYYYLAHKFPEKYSLFQVPLEFSGRFSVGWYETFTADVDEVNTLTYEKKSGEIFSAKNFLFEKTAKRLAKQLKEIDKTWWGVAIYPTTDNKLYNVRYSDTLYQQEEFKKIHSYALERFNKGLFSYMFKRSGKHYDTCSCAMCSLRKMFDSVEVKNALSQIVGETVTELNETFCSKYETGDYLSIHHDKNKGDYAFVYQLTEDWNPSYGGLLNFYDSTTKEVYETVNPIFNSLTIFKIKDVVITDHFVSENVSSHTRFAFTGWFSVAKSLLSKEETWVSETHSLSSILTSAQLSTPTPLCEIMTRHKSDKGHDKGHGRHNYTLVYDSLLKEKRENELRVFELGVGTNNVSLKSSMGINGRPGASLYGWEEYLPKSQIYGADIDKSILFSSGRIKTFYCDQTDASCIADMWAQPELALPFDLIVEDGLHTFQANKCFLENSIHKLNSDGYYIVEDILESEISLFENQLQIWRDMYPGCTFTLVKIPLKNNTYDDNNLLVVHKKK
jgi:Rps23 Pro-64 3,4-dihydroxylase Tpa1-like proline 4-hydroxylase